MARLVERKLCPSDSSGFLTTDWRKANVRINDADGSVVFQQDDVEVPQAWTDLAARIVAHKYFYGRVGDIDREFSVKQLVGRIAHTIAQWGLDGKYFLDKGEALDFEDELSYILIHQYACLNSPVQFNIGTPNAPQFSACFIISVEDHMDHILENGSAEGRLFKHGSGTGSNRSPLRSSYEHTTGGGYASGPVTFMAIYDEIANVVKSGGKTRRAAKMEILNVDHPDILVQRDGSIGFIGAKALREKMAHTLAQAGFDPKIGGEIYTAIGLQNANHSVRVPDQFMIYAETSHQDWETKEVVNGAVVHTYKAREVFHEMAKAAHACGDPGIQFDDAMNMWNTVPNFGRINATNPCGEFVHVDDSACNLSSINLKKFRTGNKSFDFKKFMHVVDIMITAQEILVSNACYPTEKIGRNTEKLRPLGLGYSNLGALLMSWGIAYDSDEGRAWCGAITAIMTGEALVQSAKLASAVGPFDEFKNNKEAYLSVVSMHIDHLKEVAWGSVQPEAKALAEEIWGAAEAGCVAVGYRNSQVTLLAPTGTISFMMGCETTGIEPVLSLRMTKVLAGGGELELDVMESVTEALKAGGAESIISPVLEHIRKFGTVEGCTYLTENWLSVFDTSFNAPGFKRCISWDGHIKMMAAAQPFLSGAISKTINMPNSATVEDIEKCYRKSWEMGLKNIAIYRDGCKRTQPLTNGGKVHEKEEEAVTSKRRKLPDTRVSKTHKFEVAGHEGYLTVGFFEDGTIGEIFLKMSKEGTFASGCLDAWSTAVSLALQYGCPITKIIEKFRHWRFEPHGPTGNDDIRIATSIVDYVSRFIDSLVKEEEPIFIPTIFEANPKTFSPADNVDTTGALSVTTRITTNIAPSTLGETDAPFCRHCGVQMRYVGSCYSCVNCGADSGCG